MIALLVGGPLLAISVLLFVRLRRRYAVKADGQGLYVYAGIFSLGFIPFAKIDNIIWHVEHFTRHGRSLELLLADNNGLNLSLFYRIQSRVVGYRSKVSLFLLFTLCKGSAEVNARSIIAARLTNTRSAERSERHNVFRVATTEGFTLLCKATGYVGGYLLNAIRRPIVAQGH